MSTPLLVHATLLWCAPASAAPPDDPVVITVTGSGRDADAARADAACRRDVAMAAALKPLAHPLQTQSEGCGPDGWPGAAQEAVEVATDAGFEVRLNTVLQEPAQFVARHVVRGVTVAPSLAPREGWVVLALNPETVGLAKGDVVLGTTDGPLRDFDAVARAVNGLARVTVRRGGAVIQVQLTLLEPIPQPDLTRLKAPTCGPCCHGHCQELPQGGVGGLK